MFRCPVETSALGQWQTIERAASTPAGKGKYPAVLSVVRQVTPQSYEVPDGVLRDIGWGLGDGSACSYLDPTYSGVTEWGGESDGQA